MPLPRRGRQPEEDDEPGLSKPGSAPVSASNSASVSAASSAVSSAASSPTSSSSASSAASETGSKTTTYSTEDTTSTTSDSKMPAAATATTAAAAAVAGTSTTSTNSTSPSTPLPAAVAVGAGKAGSDGVSNGGAVDSATTSATCRPPKVGSGDTLYQVLSRQYIQFYYGRSPSAKNNLGETPLLESARVGDVTGVFMNLLHCRLTLSSSVPKTPPASKPSSSEGGGQQQQQISEQEAFMNVKDNQGSNVIHLASGLSNPTILKLVLGIPEVDDDKGNGKSGRGSSNGRNYLLYPPLVPDVTPPNINSKNKGGITPLHLAIYKNQEQIVPILLKNGSNVHLQETSHGMTPLIVACRFNNTNAITKLLLHYGSLLHVKDNKGWNPLHIACGRDKLDIVKLLLQYGTENNGGNGGKKFNNYISSPLGLPYIENHTGDNGYTALHVAAISNHVSIVEYLIDMGGAHVESIDNTGKTPLHVALSKGYSCRNVVQILLQKYNSSLSCFETINGYTPIHTSTHLASTSTTILADKKKKKKIPTSDKKTTTNGDTSSATKGGNEDDQEDEEVQDDDDDIENRNNCKILQFVLHHIATQDATKPLSQYVETMDKAGRTPLHLSTMNGHLLSTQILLEYNAAIHARDNNGYTPLHCAALNGNVSVVEFLLSHGKARLDTLDKQGRTPLHAAISKGHDQVVKSLLHTIVESTKLPPEFALNNVNKGAILCLTAKDSIHGHSPLHYATLENQTEIVKLLVKASQATNVSIIDIMDSSGKTPFHSAVSKGNDIVVTTLIELKCNLDIRDSNGHTPLHYAALVGNRSICRKLINGGANLELKDTSNRTPLHAAVAKGNTSVVQLLVELNADLHARGKHGQQPLHYAARTDNEDVVRVLVEAGADVEERDGHGRTPLHIAAGMNQDNIVKVLIGEFRASVYSKIGTPGDSSDSNNNSDSKNSSSNKRRGQTPLHFAASQGHEATVRILIKAGAHIDSRDRWGQTPLHLTAEDYYDNNLKAAVARLLVNFGGIHTKDRKGQTPLHIAARNDNVPVARVLVAAGADRLARDRSNRTPLTWAEEYSNQGSGLMEQLLLEY